MTIQALSFVDKFLAGATRKTVRGNLIFGLDATASRERTWDMASHLQVKMFQEVASIGALDLQLVYFRGTTGANAECKASPWVGDPMQLARFMTGVRCIAGLTQIRRVLEHGLREASQKKINAMVYVGDHAEEMRDQILAPAKELGRLGVPVFMFQEGHDLEAEHAFREIATMTGGAYQRFDEASARQLGELLRAVAAFAVGGIAALQRQGSDAARLLLGQVSKNGGGRTRSGLSG